MDQILQCPKCQSTYTRVIGFEYFERVEDAESGLHVDVWRSKAYFDTDLDGNPSLRRGAAIIRFQCESCAANNDKITYQLKLIQHKGQTLIEWEFPS